MDYKTTANLKDIAMGWKTVFNNGCTFGDTSPSDTGITYEYEDKTKVKPTTIKLNKSWNDNNNDYKTRPSEIKVKVLQALEGSEQWEYIKDDNNNAVVYTVPVSDNMVVGNDFPQWAVNDDGTTTRYQYKVEEILESDSPYTAQLVDAVKATGDTTTINLTNNLTKAVYSKSADQPEMKSSQIEKVNVKEIGVGGIENEVEYYVFKWRVKFNLTQNNDSSTIKTFVDTMPNGFVYVTDEINNKGLQGQYSREQCPTKYKYKGGRECQESFPADDYYRGQSVTTSGNTITFKVRENISEIEYYTMIRADEFSRAMTSGTITNKIRLQEKGETDHIATVKITDEPEKPNENIKKMYKGGAQGDLRYALDFNPESKKLSNTKYVNITDTLKLNPDSLNTLDELGFSLTNMTVYAYNADGTYTPLNKNDYRYTVDYSNVSDTKNLTVTPVENNNKTWTVSGWTAGKEITVSVANADVNYASVGVMEYNNSSNNATYHEIPISGGSGKTKFTVKDDTTKIEIIKYDDNSDNRVITAKVPVAVPAGSESIVNTPATLHIEVPDQKYLRIEYTYTVKGFTEAKQNSNNKTNVVVSNKASFKTENAAGYDESNNNAMNVDDSDATSNTRTYPQIYKVDVNSLSINNLAATFKVLKYDTEKKNWIYASKIEEKEVNGERIRDISFEGGAEETESLNADAPELKFTTPPTSGDIPDTARHQFTLEPDAIYKFIEIKAPEGYRQPPALQNLADYDEFTFYYAYDLNGSIPNELSADVRDRIVPVIEDGRFEIPNSKYVSISAEKQFSGKAEDIPDNAEVVFKLKWSYKRDGTDLNSFDEKFPIQAEYKATFKAQKTLTYTKNENTVTWQGLPDGYYGKPIYYYVEEVSYSYEKGGKTYHVNSSNDFAGGKFKPIYTNNGTNSNGDTITVTNASGLVIRKEWKDINGNDITPPHEVGSTSVGMSIGFTITAVVKENNQTVTLDIDKTLNPDNNYEYAIDAGEKVRDTEGKEYNLTDLKDFQIVENLTKEQQDELGDDYISSPAYELSNNMGLIKLINTSTLSDKTNVSVQKVWVGGRTDEVIVQLYRTQVSDLTPAQIANLPSLPEGKTAVEVEGNETLNTANSFKKIWSDLENVDNNGVRYYYYVKEISTFQGVTTDYDVSVTSTEQNIVITNQEETNITVIKNWAGMDGLTDTEKTNFQQNVVVELKYSSDGNNWQSFNPKKTLILSSETEWKRSFSGLEKVDGNGKQYHYKVEEVKVGTNESPQNVFNISYDSQNIIFGESDSSKTVTVTNTLKTGGLEVEKKWYDDDATNRKPVTVKIYRQVKQNINGANTVVMNTSLDQQATIAGISRNMSRQLTMNRVNNPLPTLKLGSAGAIQILANEGNTNEANTEVTKISEGIFSIKINEFTYDETTHKLRFTIPESVMDKIDNNTIISDATTHDKEIRFYIPKDLLTGYGFTKIANKTWVSHGNYGYECRSEVLVTSPDANWYVKVWGDSPAGDFEFDVVVDDSGGSESDNPSEEPESYESVNVTVPNVESFATLTLSADSWKNSISGLPLRDANGNEYIYFIKEDDVPGYKPVGYYLENGTSKTVNSTELVENGTRYFKIHNAVDDNSSATLPTVGGKGTLPYTATGMTIMISAGAIIFFKRRYRERKRKSA